MQFTPIDSSSSSSFRIAPSIQVLSAIHGFPSNADDISLSKEASSWLGQDGNVHEAWAPILVESTLVGRDGGFVTKMRVIAQPFAAADARPYINYFLVD